MRQLDINQAERVRIIRMMFDSIPQVIRFEVARREGDGPPTGTIEVVGSRWMFRKAPVTQELGAENAVQKGFWDNNFAIYVCPDQDVRVTMRSRHITIKHLLYALAAVVGLAVLSVAVMAILRHTA